MTSPKPSNRPDPPPAPGARLDSWKEIAEHIGRDVRTAIRWEHERGLPVHRVPGGKRGTVFAFSEEIDAWLLQSRQDTPPPVAANPSTPVRRRLLWAIALALVLVSAIAWGLSVRRVERGPVDAVSFEGTRVVVRNRGGAVLWSHDFGRKVVEVAESQADGLVTLFWSSDDLDGDGGADLVLSVAFEPEESRVAPPRGELFAFSASGRVMWTHRLDQEVTFGAGTYGPPWRHVGHPVRVGGPQVVVFEVDGAKRVAWVEAHHTWWPSILTVLDAAGRPLSAWVHSGVIFSVVATRGPEGPRLLVGGISNSRAAGFLAVLDGRWVEGTGPEDAGSPFACLSCPPGRPLRYFVIQPSELTTAIAPYNTLSDIRTDDAGVEVRTLESPESSAFNVQAIARFSPTFTLEHVAWSSAWDPRHRELERAGKLDHAAEACPERGRPPRVREWTPGGWVDVNPAGSHVAVNLHPFSRPRPIRPAAGGRAVAVTTGSP